MRELTRLEYREICGTADNDGITAFADIWNMIHTDDEIQVTFRRVNGHPMIYRERLPKVLADQLERCEAAGVVYVDAARIDGRVTRTCQR